MNQLYKDFVNKATALANEKKYKEAELYYMNALQIKPEESELLGNLASLRVIQKRFSSAVLYYRQILQQDPYDVETWTNLLFQSGMHAIWDNYDADVDSMKKVMNELPAFFTGSMLMNIPHTFEELYHWLQKRNEGNSDLQKIIRETPFDHSAYKAGKKLKIAYFTTDVGPSPCGYVLGGLWEHHNHEDFEWHCFCTADLSGKTEEYAKALVDREVECFDYFHDVSSIKDFKELAQKIYDEKIDILIDVNMFGNKMWPALAYKPAPVIVGFMGVPSTTGMAHYDYMIGDKFTIPEDQRQFFSEKIKDMPLCYHPADDNPAVFPGHASRTDVLLPEDKVVYCSFVTPFKITPHYFDMWCRILKAVPDSVLWLLSRDDAEEDNLRAEAFKRGISPSRIIFLNCMSRPLFLLSFKNADLFLDSEIWQAHSTCIECLVSGVPLLTKTGDCFAARVPSTMLKTFGLPEMVCATEDEYEQKAIELGNNPEKLNALKAKTKALMGPENPLFNMKQYAKWFEDNLKEMAAEKGLL